VAFCPKVILVTTKDEVPPVFKALAMNLRSKTWMMAGWADADSPAGEALLTQFKVGGTCWAGVLVPHAAKLDP
jgi:hypothetical protein